MKEAPYITGLSGCRCHPFKSWDECDKAHKQKFNIGDPVMNRHTGEEGTIFFIYPDPVDKGYVTVNYGPLERDKHLENVAMLVKLEKTK